MLYHFIECHIDSVIMHYMYDGDHSLRYQLRVLFFNINWPGLQWIICRYHINIQGCHDRDISNVLTHLDEKNE